MFLYVIAESSLIYSAAGRELYIETGTILKVEVLSLQLFKICMNNSDSFVYERTEFDFFLRHGTLKLLSRKAPRSFDGAGTSRRIGNLFL